MKIESLKGYGVSVSDAESNWSPEFKAKIVKTSQKVIMNNLNFIQKIKVMFYFLLERKRASRLDISDIRKRGMKNEKFLKQQFDYLSLYSAVKKTVGKETALSIMHKVMEATAAEAMLNSLPDEEDIRKVGGPFEVFRQIFSLLPKTTKEAGDLEITISENSDKAFQFDVHWCIWLELAKKMGVPEACIPNCYADEIAYPDYFKPMGVKYCRKGSLANGAKLCDFRFEKVGE